MKRWRVGLIVGTIFALGLVTAAWTVKLQQVTMQPCPSMQPCPFDPDLSLGVAFQGGHLHFDTWAIQEKTMNARIAWFLPVEELNPDAFSDRVAEEPPEEDRDWWNTLYPTTLIVQVKDAKKRLGKLEVWNFDTNLLDGTILAKADGSAITGSLTLSSHASFRQLVIKDKKDKPLVKPGIKNPETVLWLVEEWAKWVPHPPKREVTVEL